MTQFACDDDCENLPERSIYKYVLEHTTLPPVNLPLVQLSR